MNILEIKRRQKELAAIASKALADQRSGSITTKAFIEVMEPVTKEYEEVEDNLKAYNASLKFSGLDGAQHTGVVMPGMRVKGSAASPLHFDTEGLKSAYDALASGQPFTLRTKGFNSADSLLPAELQQLVVGPAYENRLMDRLPVQPITAPSLEYVRHTATTGTPAIVGEGQPKPELVYTTSQITVAAKKLAAHTGVSWEILSDWDRFVTYVQQELKRQVVNTENAELIAGDGTATHLTGFLATSGILTATKGADTDLDAVEKAIAALRVGAALAEANLIVLHPSTFSALRRSKDSQLRYLLNPDPSADEARSLWGIDVVATTQIAAGTALVLDTTKFGFVVLREAIVLRTGTDGSDFTSNIVRFVAEERLNLAVERPTAVLKLTGLTAS